jgi:hypothetical protein
MEQTLTRVDQWEQKLEAFFMQRVYMPFGWGTNDCCSFAFDSIEAITGVDIGGWFRGRYTMRLEAFMLLKEYSGGSVVETWDKLAEDYGLEEIPIGEIQAGDVVTMKIQALDPIAGRLSNGVSIGIKSFKEGFFSPGKHHLAMAMDPEIIKAWRV